MDGVLVEVRHKRLRAFQFTEDAIRNFSLGLDVETLGLFPKWLWASIQHIVTGCNDRVIETNQQDINVGDWVVEDDFGEPHVLSNVEFHRRFKLA